MILLVSISLAIVLALFIILVMETVSVLSHTCWKQK